MSILNVHGWGIHMPQDGRVIISLNGDAQQFSLAVEDAAYFALQLLHTLRHDIRIEANDD